MTRSDPNVRLKREHAKRLERLATMSGMSQAEIVAAALAACFSLECSDPREAVTARRLDQLMRQLEHLERDQTILLEMLAFFIRDSLSAKALVPESDQAPRGPGNGRFEQFIEQVAHQLQRGRSLVGEVEQEFCSQRNRLPVVNEDDVAGTAGVPA